MLPPHPGDASHVRSVAGTAPFDTDACDVRILLIDDDPLDAQAVIETAGELGFTQPIDVCETAETGLVRLRDSLLPRPDLVLLDLNLPGADGKQALMEVKQDPSLRSIQVVAFTVVDCDETTLESPQHGLLKNFRRTADKSYGG